MSTEC